MAKLSRTFAVPALLALEIGCVRPTHNPSVLKDIRSESEVLMQGPAPKTYAAVPKGRWPSVITSLKPNSVTIFPDGVDIMMKPDFDGGWGYFVPRHERHLPEPVRRFSALGEGVYWYHPY